MTQILETSPYTAPYTGPFNEVDSAMFLPGTRTIITPAIIPVERRGLNGSIFGQGLPAGISATEAVSQCGLDYQVVLEDVFNPRGRQIKNRKVITKLSSNGSPEEDFAVVSSDYHLLTNREMFSPLDNLVKSWPVRNAGFDLNGKRSFIILRAEEAEIKSKRNAKVGDIINSYFAIYNNFNGRNALKIIEVIVRLVCTNGMTSNDGRLNISIYHNESIKENYADRLRLADKMAATRDRSLNALNLLADTNMGSTAAEGEKNLARILAEVFPDPTKKPVSNARALANSAAVLTKYEQGLTEARTQRSTAMELFRQFNDTQGSAFANTGFSAINSITETTNWLWVRESKKRETAIVMGDRALVNNKAHALIMNFARNN
jgi:hypothetical protein